MHSLPPRARNVRDLCPPGWIPAFGHDALLRLGTIFGEFADSMGVAVRRVQVGPCWCRVHVSTAKDLKLLRRALVGPRGAVVSTLEPPTCSISVHAVAVVARAVPVMRRAIWTHLTPLEQLASALDDELWAGVAPGP